MNKASLSRRPTKALIHLDNLQENLRRIRERIGPSARAWAVVKADAYGHGFAPVAQALLEAGAWGLALATVDEALEARERFPQAPALLMGPSFPSDAPALVAAGVEVAVGSQEVLQALAAASRQLNRAALAHLKIDSGMGRFGQPAREIERHAHVWIAPRVEWRGVFTHFAVSDTDSPEDRDYTRGQLQAFLRAAGAFRRALPPGAPAPMLHACNSGGILQHPEAFLDAVRPGVMLYGHLPDPTCERSVALLPAMTFETRIAALRDHPEGASLSYGRTYRCPSPRRIALLPVGYADGYDRGLSNRGEVLICGRRAPVRGRVCMDQILVDVTDIPGAEVGDRVILFGGDGRGGGGSEAAPSVEEIARLLGTIPYEVTCRVSRRVPRVFESTPAEDAPRDVKKM